MKKLCLLLAVLIFSASFSQGESYFEESFRKQVEESRKINATITDQKIIEYIEFKYEIDPKLQREFQDTKKNPEELRTFLIQYRKFHNDAGIQMATLEGLSAEDIAQLRQIMEFKKQEYYASVEAERRLEGFTGDQFTTMLSEGVKLIEDFYSDAEDPVTDTIRMTDDFPESLTFLELDMIDISGGHCRLFLHKGIGKGIGFSVSKQEGEWKLFSFNEYKSWDRKAVDFR